MHMLCSYKILNKTVDLGIRWRSTLQRKKSVYLYKVNKETRFFVRKGTLDSYIIFENWRLRVYTKGPISIRPKDTVVDIGAQIGCFSIYAAQLAKDGTVYAYEPHPGNFELLKKNKKLNKIKNLRIFNTGVSNKKGFSKLFLSEDNSGAHSIFEADTKKFLAFKTTTLAEIVKKIGKINFLKIDAEGAEYPILLSSGEETFNLIDKIVLEYHDCLDHGHNYLELVKLLEKMGYKVSLEGDFFTRKVFGLGIIKAIK